MDKGNDVLPEQYGAAWIYTRYQIRLHRKMDYSGPMTLSTWIEPGRQQARVTLNVTIRQGGDLTAEGRLESCIYSLTQRRPLRLSANGERTCTVQFFGTAGNLYVTYTFNDIVVSE